MATFVNRTCDSLEGVWQFERVWGQGSAIDDGNTYFSIFLFPPKQEWQLCTTEGPTSVFKRFGGKGGAIDGRNIYFLFSYFFPQTWVASLVNDSGDMKGIEIFRVRPDWLLALLLITVSQRAYVMVRCPSIIPSVCLAADWLSLLHL